MTLMSVNEELFKLCWLGVDGPEGGFFPLDGKFAVGVLYWCELDGPMGDICPLGGPVWVVFPLDGPAGRFCLQSGWEVVLAVVCGLLDGPAVSTFPSVGCWSFTGGQTSGEHLSLETKLLTSETNIATI